MFDQLKNLTIILQSPTYNVLILHLVSHTLTIESLTLSVFKGNETDIIYFFNNHLSKHLDKSLILEDPSLHQTYREYDVSSCPFIKAYENG